MSDNNSGKRSVKRLKLCPKDGRVASIDTLPDHLLVDVLSFLPSKEAARTSILSRAWRNVWKHIHGVDLRVVTPRGSRKLSSAFWKKTVLSYNHVVSELLSAKWKRLRIEFGRPCRHAHEIDLLIGHGTRRGVQELCLNFQNSTDKACYEVPPLTFTSATLKRLELDKCVLHLPPASARLTCLSTLNLCNTRFNSTTLKTLISACPVLEDLSIVHCDFAGPLVFIDKRMVLKILRIRCKRAVTLKVLILWAPSLRLLELRGLLTRGIYLMNELVSLHEANLHFSGSIGPCAIRKIFTDLRHAKKIKLCCNRHEVVSGDLN